MSSKHVTIPFIVQNRFAGEMVIHSREFEIIVFHLFLHV